MNFSVFLLRCFSVISVFLSVQKIHNHHALWNLIVTFRVLLKKVIYYFNLRTKWSIFISLPFLFFIHNCSHWLCIKLITIWIVLTENPNMRAFVLGLRGGSDLSLNFKKKIKDKHWECQSGCQGNPRRHIQKHEFCCTFNGSFHCFSDFFEPSDKQVCS